MAHRKGSTAALARSAESAAVGGTLRRMALDLTDMARQFRYLVRDRALQGTPVGDVGLMFADAAEGIHYEFQSAMRRLAIVEQRMRDIESQISTTAASPQGTTSGGTPTA